MMIKKGKRRMEGERDDGCGKSSVYGREMKWGSRVGSRFRWKREKELYRSNVQE